MDSLEPSLVTRILEILKSEPDIGYRPLHARLKTEPDFQAVSQKKVQVALQSIRSGYCSGDFPATQTLPWEVTDFGYKGKGVKALSPIQRGTILLKEKPIVTMKFEMARDISASCNEDMAKQMANSLSLDFMAAAFEKLPPADQARLLELCDCAALFGVDVGTQPKLLSAKFWSNGVPGPPAASDPTEEDTVLCPTVARFNHNCKPNAIYTWHGSAKAGEVCVVAVADIPAGEEVCVCYLPTDLITDTTEERQAWTKETFGFQCRCPCCEGDSAKIFEEHRLEMEKLRAEIRTVVSDLPSATSDLLGRGMRAAKKLLELCRANGYTSPARMRILGWEGYNLSVASQLPEEEVKSWAKLRHESLVLEKGEKSEEAQLAASFLGKPARNLADLQRQDQQMRKLR